MEKQVRNVRKRSAGSMDEASKVVNKHKQEFPKQRQQRLSKARVRQEVLDELEQQRPRSQST